MNKQFIENVLLTLKTNTSNSFLAQNKIGSAVRIENEKDEIFWRPVFASALPNHAFEFFPYFKEISLTKGKNDTKKYIDFADKDLIFCIDADYDYLLENTDYIGKPFVFHTYVYALENIFSYAEGLKDILEKAINTEGVTFDFEKFFKEYSAIIYDWLCYSLYSEKIKDGLLSRKDCGKIAGFNKFNNIEKDLKELKTKLKKEAKIIRNQYENLEDFDSFLARLNELGFNKNNAYLFLRGHDLFDRVTIKLMQFIGNPIANAKIESLRKEGNKIELKRFDDFRKSKNYEAYLRENNHSFQSNSFYKNIVSDIQKAFN